MRKTIFMVAVNFVGLLLLCGLIWPAAARTRPFNQVRARNSSLTPAAKAVISAAIGRDQEAYHAVAVRNGFRLKTPQSNLQATFTRRGMWVQKGNGPSWRLVPQAYGEGKNLEAVVAVRPKAEQNRVQYHHGTLTEWYVNGPAGLEQGFTIARTPSLEASGTLTLVLRLSGNMKAAVDTTGTSLTLSDANGHAEFHYTGLEAHDATGRELRSWLEVRGKRLLVQVAAARARYPIVVDPYIQAAELAASDGQPSDYLGLSVSVSGDGSTVVAGAPYATVGLNSSQGAAYVFTKPQGGQWADTSSFTAKLAASNGQVLDYLGWSVSVSEDGSTIVAGAPGADSYQGAVYVFVNSGSGWEQKADLTALGGSSGDQLGNSVSVTGDGLTVAAGAPDATVGVNTYQGAAYVFVAPPGGWADENSTAKLTASDGEAGDELGLSLSMSEDGSTVAAGAPYAPYNSSTYTAGPGAVYVFVKSTEWANANQDAELTASDGQATDNLGDSVSVSGDGSTVVAGAQYASYNSSTYTAGPGAAYVFVEPASGWANASFPQDETAKLTASSGTSGDNLGASVCVSQDGSTVLAGAPYAPYDSGTFTAGPGEVYEFTRPSGGWSAATSPQNETSMVNASGGVSGDGLGISVSVSQDGSTAVAGATGVSSYQGAAYVFSNSAQFSSFNTSRLKIRLGPPSTFQWSGSFVLHSYESIDPLTEAVTLQVGTMTLVIPPGSFLQKHNGNYVFRGVVEGVSLDVQIRVLGAGAFAFKIMGSNANLVGTTNPVTVTLTIGNDMGTETVNAHFL